MTREIEKSLQEVFFHGEGTFGVFDFCSEDFEPEVSGAADPITGSDLCLVVSFGGWVVELKLFFIKPRTFFEFSDGVV